MPSRNPYLDVAKAEDTADLLESLAWTDTLRPALLRERENYTKLLVSATLGLPVQVDTGVGPVTITREQLAGKIYGIDFVMQLFEKILTKGATAVRELRAVGINLSSSELLNPNNKES